MDNSVLCDQMGMVYQKGTVYLQGSREKKWYGKFRVYFRGRGGEEVNSLHSSITPLYDFVLRSARESECSAQ